MIPLLAAPLVTAPPLCDPKRDTAPTAANGYCLTEDEFLELGRLKLEVDSLQARLDARDAEIQVWEQWKSEQNRHFLDSMNALRQECVVSVVDQTTRCANTLSVAKRRTFWERHGLVVGYVGGFLTAAATAGGILYMGSR